MKSELKIDCPCGDHKNCYAVYPDHGWCFSCERWFKLDTELEDKSTYQTLPWRGVSTNTMRFYNVMTKVNEHGKPTSIAAPFDNGARQIRNLDEKEFAWSGEGSKASIFGLDKFEEGGEVITIFESWLDAMSGYEILRSPCISVRSASLARKDCAKQKERIDTFDKIVICTDNDEPGNKAAKDLAALFGPKARHVKMLRKDCNEYIHPTKQHPVTDPEAFRQVWKAAKRFSPPGIKSSKEDFHHIIDTATDLPAWEFPFPSLNTMTKGIRQNELILISGDEGIGKTEVIRAIEYNFLLKTDVNLGTIHMEETEDRQLRGLAGYYLDAPAHYIDNVSKEEVKTALDLLLFRENDEGRLHLCTVDEGDPEAILDRVRYLVVGLGCKIVVLDNLHKLVASLMEEDERRKLDFISNRAAGMVKNLDFTMFMLAHVNQEGRIRGSTGPSKVAHTWIHLERNLNAEVPDDRHLTYLRVKKNRFASGTGPAGILRFDPGTFKIEELNTNQELPF